MSFERHAQNILMRLREVHESNGEEGCGGYLGAVATPLPTAKRPADVGAPSRRPDGRAAVSSWFYHDGLGNRVYVQDMNFSTALALGRAGAGTPGPTGAFAADARVVLVPRHRTASWINEFERKDANNAAALRALREQETASVSAPVNAAPPPPCLRQEPSAAALRLAPRPGTAPLSKRRGIVWADKAGAVGVTDDVDALAAELQRLRNEEWRLNRDLQLYRGM